MYNKIILPGHQERVLADFTWEGKKPWMHPILDEPLVAQVTQTFHFTMPPAWCAWNWLAIISEALSTSYISIPCYQLTFIPRDPLQKLCNTMNALILGWRPPQVETLCHQTSEECSMQHSHGATALTVARSQFTTSLKSGGWPRKISSICSLLSLYLTTHSAGEASAPKSQKAPADSGDQNMLNKYLRVNMTPVNRSKSYCPILLLAFIVFEPSLFHK